MNDLQRQFIYIFASAFVIGGILLHLGKILYYLIRYVWG